MDICITIFYYKQQIFINMRKFIFICVALIAFTATNASGGNYHQPDQLRTCIVSQASPQIMPVMAVNFEAAQAVYNFTQATVPAERPVIVKTELSDGWRAPYWVPSLAINCNSNQLQFRDAYSQMEIPIQSPHRLAINRNQHNFNIDQSYGLRD